MCQVTVTTTTLPVTFASTGASITTMGTIAPISMELPAASGQSDVVVPPSLILMGLVL